MEFRNQDDEIGIPSSSSSLGYNNPHPLRSSAFSKPILSPSSSLLSPRGGGATASAGAAARNSSVFPNSTPPQLAPPPATLNPTGTAVDHSSSSSQAPVVKTPDPTPVAASAAIVKGSAADDVSFRYRECLRNHAAAVGGQVVDGCGEFMPNGDLSTPDGLKCDACGCHRSFHRKEAANLGSSYYHRGGGDATRVPLLLPAPRPQVHHNPHTPKQFQFSGFPSSPSRTAAPGLLAFGGNTSGSGGTTTESSSEERVNAGTPTPTAVSRKRFRTRFTPQQKEKMLAFAESVGWRIQKQDEASVERFCSQAGVKRQVLKVWMHNNKNTIGKIQHQHRELAEPEQLPPPSPHQQQQ